MATTPRVVAPAPAIFTSDPLEQIYAKGTLQPNLAGLAGLMLYAMQGERQAGQAQYLGALDVANQRASDLAKTEAGIDLQKEGMKEGGKLAGLGFNPADLVAGRLLFSNNNPIMTQLLQEEARSKIFKNMQTGAGSKEQTTVQSTVYPWGEGGTAGPTTITTKGPSVDSSTANNAAAAQKVRAAIMANPNLTAQQKAQMMRDTENSRIKGIQD